MWYYYQIKGKRSTEDSEGSYWVWPPIFSNRVEANSKQHARELIEKEFDKKLPMRVLHKDIHSNDFLLSIEEMHETSRYQKLFIDQTCEICGETFRIIDKYNDLNCINKSQNVCSNECAEERKQILQVRINEAENLINRKAAVIYCITNVKTNMVYIGKTTQVFTLRWYQHFFQGGNTKFHQAVKQSDPTDWTFKVIEVVEIPVDMFRMHEINAHITSREMHYIRLYDSINSGYNTKEESK